ncbi:MAG: DUF2284 domain-containing protein [Lachnospiraceae bacterium]|nr:DUF2284 domain-containing protein [Lachnospiraceae bacterium]MDD3615882.1 DUF2284 domain-containing protein [Lachnospiraceae bacterium]
MNKLTREKIEEAVRQLPILEYYFIKASEIPFTKEVQKICEMECPRYGKSWSCPPAVGSMESCQAHCNEFDHAFVFSTTSWTDDSLDMDACMKARVEHDKVVSAIWRLTDVNHAFMISSESCSICEKCSYPDKTCRHKDLMHPCIESQGIIVASLAEQLGMTYYIDEHQIVWFGILFF